MRVLLISLGTGPSVEHGIAYSIRHHKPDRVIYFATEQSVPTKARVEALLNGFVPKGEIVKIADGDDPNDIYRQACGVLNRLFRESGDIEVYVDFTSGTKAMSAGLFAAALAYGVSNLIYVSGQRGPDGRVISNTERVITFPPTEIFADRLYHQIVESFNNGLFSAALRLIRQGLQEIHIPERRRELEDLQKLCSAYQAWDWFDHQEAHKHFEKIDKPIIERWGEQIAHNKGWVAQIAKRPHCNADISECYGEPLLIDLWLNAKRRMTEGHWIDATARLYRLVELIAQFRLARQYGLDTGKLDVTKLPEDLRSKYDRLRDQRGRVKLGLEQAYQLLADLNDPLGQCYDERLKGALQARNESIAGHGLRPVTEDSSRRLAECVRELMAQVIPNWEEQAQRGCFPSLPNKQESLPSRTSTAQQ